MDPALDVSACIARLGLTPHPEGGHYREFFRSRDTVRTNDGRTRAALTAIHFLLPRGAHSRWHEVHADEQWTFLAGEPLELLLVTRQAGLERVRLGPLPAAVPSHVVPAGAWQAARTRTGPTLVTCTVGPGFDFADFRLLDGDPAARARLAQLDGELLTLL